MKLIIFFATLCFALVAAAGYFSYQQNQEKLLAYEQVALEANLEALTQTTEAHPLVVYFGSAESAGGVVLVKKTCYTELETPDYSSQQAHGTSNFRVYPLCAANAKDVPCTCWGYGEIHPRAKTGECYQYEPI